MENSVAIDSMEQLNKIMDREKLTILFFDTKT